MPHRRMRPRSAAELSCSVRTTGMYATVCHSAPPVKSFMSLTRTGYSLCAAHHEAGQNKSGTDARTKGIDKALVR